MLISGGSCDSDFGLSRSSRPRIALIIVLNGVFHYVTCTIILLFVLYFPEMVAPYLKCISVLGVNNVLVLVLVLDWTEWVVRWNIEGGFRRAIRRGPQYVGYVC